MTPGQKRAALALAPVVLFGAFLAGRYTAHPPPSHDERKAVTDVKATATTVAKVDVAKHETATRDTDTTVHTVTRWRPAVAAVGGCPAIPASVEQETVRETHAAVTRTADTKLAKQVQQQRETEAHQTVVELHTVEARPNWSVLALVGAQIGGRHEIVPGPYVVGASLERRIVGPVSVGIWGLSSAAGGISVRVDF